MKFRMTVGLGQDTVDPDVLQTLAGTVHEHLSGNISGAAVAVDPVKATVQLGSPSTPTKPSPAAQRALAVTGRALHGAGLPAPVTILTAEAEAVPAPATGRPVASCPVAAVSTPTYGMGG